METEPPTNAHSEIDILSDALHDMMIDSGFVSKVHILIIFNAIISKEPFSYWICISLVWTFIQSAYFVI